MDSEKPLTPEEHWEKIDGLVGKLDEVFQKILPEATNPEEGATLLESLKDDLQKAKKADGF